MRKVLNFLKDFGNGVLYLGLMAGFMLLVAAGMYYFKPHEIFADPVELTAKISKASDHAMALRLLELGGKVLIGSVALLWISMKSEALWRRRRMKQQAEAPAPIAEEKK